MPKSAVTKRSQMAKVMKRGNKLYLDYRVNGERRQRSTGLEDTPSNRKKLEKEVIPQLMLKLKCGDLSRPSEKKFSHYYAKWLRTKEKDKSFIQRKWVFDKVNAHFADLFVGRITRLYIKEYIASLNIKSHSKPPYLNCIRGVLDLALDDEIITKNPCYGIKLQSESKNVVEPFSQSEVETILSKTNGMFRNYLAIAFYSGMRSGEILGLMHSDIKSDSLHVKRSISKGRVTSPKTIGSIREVPMFEAVKPYLEDQQRRSKSLYLFEKNGDYIHDVTYFRCQWRKVIEQSGITYRKIYNTRHTFITAMLNSGKYKILDIAAIVGHSSAKMIMTTYAGFIKDNHLKIDTSVDIFGDSLVTPEKVESFEMSCKALK